MEFNTVLFGFTAVSMSASFIGCLIGYHIREKRHAENLADSRDFFSKERTALRTALETSEGKLVEMETATNKAIDAMSKLYKQAKLESKQWEAAHDDAVSKYSAQVLELKRWKDCVDTQLMIAHLWDEELHSSDPEAALAALLYWERSIALDPAVSKPAKNLMVRAKREHGKKLRRLHERDMQILRDKADGYANLHQMAEEELVKVQASLELRRSALLNTARDKLRLPAVRTAFLHAYWEEVARLRTLNKETK